MIGLDTNVLVRYLVQDDADQARRAARLIETRCTPDQPGFVNRIVLCELVWVLESCYDQSRDVVAAILSRLLRSAELIIEDAKDAEHAIKAYRGRGVDFADALVGETNRRNGCATTATFDRKAARLESFSAVS